jgi:hypothetical protein
LSSLAEAVQPNPQDLRFLNYFLNNPALKELIDVRVRKKIIPLQNRLFIHHIFH